MDVERVDVHVLQTVTQYNFSIKKVKCYRLSDDAVRTQVHESTCEHDSVHIQLHFLCGILIYMYILVSSPI